MDRVLLVDNEPDWLVLMSRALAGYEVEQAGSYEEALSLLEKGPRFDVAVVDLNLVDSDDGLGRKILTRLRDESPTTRRIALTAWPPARLRRDIFLLYGVDEYLFKPQMPLSLLRETVEAALAQVNENIDPDVRASRSELSGEFRTLRDGAERKIAQRLRTLQNDRQAMNHLPDRRAGGARARMELDAKIAELVTKRAALRHACSRLEALIRDMTDASDCSRAFERLANLEREFGDQASFW
jgi:CheY-like chemotaxis protein